MQTMFDFMQSKSMMEELFQAGVDEGFFSLPTVRMLGTLSDFHAVVEEEIRRAMKRYPDRARVIYWGAFAMCSPYEKGCVLSNCELMPLYRGHCREICERIGKREKLDPPTKAEILWGMSEASFKAPFRRSAAGLMMRLADDIMPEEYKHMMQLTAKGMAGTGGDSDFDVGTDYEMMQDWPDEHAVLLEEIHRSSRYKQDWRAGFDMDKDSDRPLPDRFEE